MIDIVNILAQIFQDHIVTVAANSTIQRTECQLLHNNTDRRLKLAKSKIALIQADSFALFDVFKKGKTQRKEVAETREEAAETLNKKKRWREEDKQREKK